MNEIEYIIIKDRSSLISRKKAQRWKFNKKDLKLKIRIDFILKPNCFEKARTDEIYELFKPFYLNQIKLCCIQLLEFPLPPAFNRYQLMNWNEEERKECPFK